MPTVLREPELQGVEVGREPSDLAPGLVVRQEPVAGSPLPEDGIVRYWVSAVPPTVPNIVRMPEGEALAELSRRDLVGERIGTEPSDLAPGLVTRQDPVAGSPIPEDGIVRFWVSPSPTPWAFILGAVLLVGALSVKIGRKLFPPRATVTFTPTGHRGEQLIETETSNRLDLSVEIELRTVRDPGEQELKTDGPLIQD